MPKTQHWQWYVEEFSPTEQHHHAIDERTLLGALRFSADRGAAIAGLRQDAGLRRRHAERAGRREDLSRNARASGAGRRRRPRERPDSRRRRGRDAARGAALAPTSRAARWSTSTASCVDLSKKYLPEWSDGAFDDPRARVIVGDALAFMRANDERYGVILSDLTEPLEDSPSNPLFNDDVFSLIKSRLRRRRHLRAAGEHRRRAQRRAALQDGAHAAPALRARRLVLHARAGVRYRMGVPRLQRPHRSVACSTPSAIDAYCARLRGENFFYDSVTHRRLFALPLYLRGMLAAGGDTF